MLRSSVGMNFIQVLLFTVYIYFRTARQGSGLREVYIRRNTSSMMLFCGMTFICKRGKAGF